MSNSQSFIERNEVVTPPPAEWWNTEFTESALKPMPLLAQSSLPKESRINPPRRSFIATLWRRLRKTFRILTWPIAVILNLIQFIGLGIMIIYFWIVPTLPNDATILDVKLQQPLRVYNTAGLLMGEFGAERREPVNYKDIPLLLTRAFLAAEDSRFFEHSGVDLQSLGRAALNLINTGELSQGGSTITMQLVRNLFLTPEKSFQRKLAELLLAMHLESRFSKEQIFELYQNRIFFGHQAYGIAAAAKIYYNKALNELSLAQMATLAGIPQAPSAHNPITRQDKAIARRAYVLERMLTLGWITPQEHAEAVAATEDAHLTPVTIEMNAPYLAEMARREAQKLYGEQVYTSGLRFTTTVDAKLQSLAQRALNNTLLEYDRRHGYRGAEARTDPTASREILDKFLANYPPIQDLTAAIVLEVKTDKAHLYLGAGQEQNLTAIAANWAVPNPNTKQSFSLNKLLTPGDVVRVITDENGQLNLAQIPKVEGALAVLSPADGAIKALVGGFDFKRSQFNRAVDARRQPGSSFKPFVYAAALSKDWTPTSIINDSPLQIQDGKQMWRPKNIDGKYLGKITLRQALAQSRNLAAVQLLRSIGVEETRKFIINRFGFRSEQLPHGLSLALGSGEAAPLQMAGAFARFANGGFRADPYLIAQIQDDNGSILPLPPRDSERVLDSKVVEWMRDLLQEVIRTGTGKRALALNRTDLAGKTGTSNGVRDAWFCGFNSELVAVAWMGFDNYLPLGDDEVGGHSALDLWITFMGKALSEQQDKAQPNSDIDDAANLAASVTKWRKN